MKKKWSLIVASLLFLCYYIFKLTNFVPKIMISGSDWGKYLSIALLVLAGVFLAVYLFIQQKIADKFKALIVKWNVPQIVIFFIVIAGNIGLIFFSKFLGTINIPNLVLLICANFVISNILLAPKGGK